MADQVVVPSLQRQALLVLCRTWHPARSLTALPVELSRLVWDQLKASHAQEQQQAATAAGGTADAAQAVPMPCSVMFPLVRDVWRVRELDLSDAGRWLTDHSLGALAYARGLESVRLTMCRFLTDAGIGQLARCGSLTTVDLSWTELGDAAMPHLASCRGLTSLNLTGLPALTDRGVSALLKLTGMRRLALVSRTGGGKVVESHAGRIRRIRRGSRGGTGSEAPEDPGRLGARRGKGMKLGELFWGSGWGRGPLPHPAIHAQIATSLHRRPLGSGMHAP